MPLQEAMLFLVVPAVMVVMTMAMLPMEETSTQATSAEMVALLWVTMAMVVLEEMPMVVSQLTCVFTAALSCYHAFQATMYLPTAALQSCHA